MTAFAKQLADIDLTDPSLNQAASKIQATFRGHRVRKSPLHEPKNPGDKEQEGEAKDQVDDADKELPDVSTNIRPLLLALPWSRDYADVALKLFLQTGKPLKLTWRTSP
ncbi:hypothetical protein HPB49_001268 [Dermacentor silvarum]|uniref:Uncharacterized protein n=1 Tax=Dermacentor silvarum TaxID=543639 RepID=A0ACB8CIW8_DERSI|nr:hypothetical protein HPB49_001268 [Dermacentor silvarum]